MKQTTGIHHISAIVGHPQEIVDFYTGVLGLRLVKQTVNFDDPQTYHLYFGNHEGAPGTLITFFPWKNGQRGRIGGGQVGITSYMIPSGTLAFWKNRLETFDVSFEEVIRLGTHIIQFDDVHGLRIELIESETDIQNKWSHGEVTESVQIRGFYGAVLFSTNYQETIKTLTNTLGFHVIEEDDKYIRFKSNAKVGQYIDLLKENKSPGKMGVGTVHHIAFRAKDQADHVDWQQHALNQKQAVTDIKNRFYFDALYFREAGEILFEIATDPPGFTVDEPEETMGQQLKLPPQYEGYRGLLKKKLTPLNVRVLDKEGG